MRDLVASTAAGLALRRYLFSEAVPHTIQGAIPYTDPGSYAVVLGGRRLILKASLVFKRKAIHNLRSQPEKILSSQAQLDVTDLETDPLLDEDLLIFALVPALITRQAKELESALAAGQPACLIHTLPANWANPLPGSPLGEIAIKSNSRQDVRVEIGGRDLDGNFQEEAFVLPPRARTLLQRPFQSLAYLRLSQPATSEIGLSSKSLKEPCIVQPGQWGNMWIYGMEIILAGYLTRAEFRRTAALQVNEDFDRPVSSGKIKSLSFGELRPLAGLFGWARKFETKNSQDVLDRKDA